MLGEHFFLLVPGFDLVGVVLGRRAEGLGGFLCGGTFLYLCLGFVKGEIFLLREGGSFAEIIEINLDTGFRE